MPHTKAREIKSLEKHEGFFEHIAPSGYTIALNIHHVQPEVFHTTKPRDWVEKYKRRRYVIVDPVMKFIFNSQGTKRWSDIKGFNIPLLKTDFERAAAKFGLNYGLVVVSTENSEDRVKNVLSMSRDDREFKDDEIKEIEVRFEAIIEGYRSAKDLSERQITLLWLLANGATRKEAAQQLCVSEDTIKKDAEFIRQIWDTANTTEAVGIAISRGIITPYNDIRW